MVDKADEHMASFESFDPMPLSNLSPKPERLKKLKNSQVKLTQIQKDLEILVDSMAKNTSIFSRASNFWGRVPLWQKILAGILIAAAPIVAGVFAQLLLWLVITAFVSAIYIGASVVLDDHFNHSQHSTQNIKLGITSLAEGLQVLMTSLEQISEALTEQVDLFSKENQQFTEHVSDLGKGNVSLTEEIKKLQDIEKKLRLRQGELEKTCNELSKSVVQQTKLLEETQSTLTKVKIDHTDTQTQLKEKTSELAEIKDQLTTAINNYKRLEEFMNETLKVMTTKMSENAPQQELFQQQLTAFSKIIAKICNEANELTEVKKSFRQKTNEYQDLIARYERIVIRFEKTYPAKQRPTALNLHGIYANHLFEEPNDSGPSKNLN